MRNTLCIDGLHRSCTGEVELAAENRTRACSCFCHKPTKRTAISQSSSKKRAQSQAERPVKQEALSRDGGCVMRHLQGKPYGKLMIPFCFGRLEKDEVISRSRGGDPTDIDGVQILCNVHNTWKEDHPAEAEALGFARHSWDR